MTEPDRRSVLAGVAAIGTAALWPTGASAGPGDPDLGPCVLIIDAAAPRERTQAQIDAIFARQQRAEFGDGRYALLLKPGRHALEVNVGFYTQVAGLGTLPGDVTIDGHLHVEADWNGGVALVNFWRSAENLTVRPPDGTDRWAVSQAAPYRRVHLAGDLALDDGGWSSGGFMADCRIDATVRSGSQQQWFTRSSLLGGWAGANWNMAFAGVEGAPSTTFPEPPVTSLSDVPAVREKPFLQVDAAGAWSVFVPALRRHSRGTSWAAGPPPGIAIPLDRFLIVSPGTGAATIDAALAGGRHLLFTPGLYSLNTPLRVTRPGTVVLGLGYPTLTATGGNKAITVADVPGVVLSGVLVEAGAAMSPLLVEIGPRGATGDHRADPITLSDLFFRVGGASVGNCGTCLEINSRHVVCDHLWIWRADHGDRAGGRVHTGWTESRAEHGLVVNGDDVTMLGLFVEHFRDHQVVWRGERGRTVFFQCELPYDPPSQAAWVAGATRGRAAYKVADGVRDHRAVALGIYANFTADPSIVLESAVEVPRVPGVMVEDVTTISLGGGKGTIAHPVNEAGAAAGPGAIRRTLRRYPPPA